MERVGEILSGALRRLRNPEAALAWLSGAWPLIVGKSLATHTRPVRCTAGCLQLTADGTAWQQQLEIMKHALCVRINRAWGASLVRELKFVPARPIATREADNNHTPFIRRRS
jgi:predicted nucleic acid-binding Zn ribbon protein